jgi:hypothetical protein
MTHLNFWMPKFKTLFKKSMTRMTISFNSKQIQLKYSTTTKIFGRILWYSRNLSPPHNPLKNKRFFTTSQLSSNLGAHNRRQVWTKSTSAWTNTRSRTLSTLPRTYLKGERGTSWSTRYHQTTFGSHKRSALGQQPRWHRPSWVMPSWLLRMLS